MQAFRCIPGFTMQHHTILCVGVINDQSHACDFGKAACHFGNLLGMDEHPFHLGRLVCPPHPAAQTDVGPPARRLTRHDGRQVTSSKADQGIVRVERGHHHFANLTDRDRITGTRPHDLNQQVLFDHQTFLCVGFVGNCADVCRGITLPHFDAFLPQPVPRHARQRLTGHQRPLERRNIGPQFLGLLDDDAQERRCANVSIGAQIDHRLYLLLGLTDTTGKYRTTQFPSATFHQESPRREMVGKAVVDQLAGTNTRRIEHARQPPGIGRHALQLVNRPRRSKDPLHGIARHRLQTTKRWAGFL